MKNLVVLISGNGSNLQAIIDACQQHRFAATVRAVISNNASAYGLIRAQQAGIATHHLNPGDFASREQFDQQLIPIIDHYQPHLVLLAGYLRILSAPFVQHYRQRLLNIHPSLLPRYPGLHTHRRALEQGDSEHGATVHFVTEQLDAGPIIVQGRVPVLPTDDEDSLSARVLRQEHIIYPLAVEWLLTGKKALCDGVIWREGSVTSE